MQRASVAWQSLFPVNGVGFRCSKENECPFRVCSLAEQVTLETKSVSFQS